MSTQTKTQPITYVDITPEWRNTAAFFTRALADGSFEKGAYAPISSAMEQAVQLKTCDPDGYDEVLAMLQRQAQEEPDFTSPSVVSLGRALAEHVYPPFSYRPVIAFWLGVADLCLSDADHYLTVLKTFQILGENPLPAKVPDEDED
jgi:hypothetical protein